MHGFRLKLDISEFHESDDQNTLNVTLFHFLNKTKNVLSFQHH